MDSPLRATRPWIATLAWIALGSWSQLVAAELLYDRFRLEIGGADRQSESLVRLDASAALPGTELDLEEDLSLDDSARTTRARLSWMPARRLEISFEASRAEREGAHRLDRTIRFGDLVFPVGVDVDSRLDEEILELAVTGWLVRGDRAGLGLILGVRQWDVLGRIGGEVRLGSAVLRVEEEGEASVPLALIGLEGRVAVGPRVRLIARLRALPEVEFEEYTGDALLIDVEVDVRVAGALRLGAAWRSSELDVTSENADFLGRVQLESAGPELFLRLAW